MISITLKDVKKAGHKAGHRKKVAKKARVSYRQHGIGGKANIMVAAMHRRLGYWKEVP